MNVAVNTVSEHARGLVCLDLIRRLLTSFDAYGVKYVHWKSNTNIAKALSGIDDFDVLVHPEDRAKTAEIFDALKILHALSPKDHWQRGIFHYIGVDIESGRLVHVHVHYALPVGFDYDKNFVLPIVDEYIASRRKFGPVYLPQVEMEYVVLVVRLAIKNALPAFLLHLPHHQWRKLKSARKNGVVTGGGHAEYVDLLAHSDRKMILQLLDGPFSFLGKDEFLACENALASNRSLWHLFRAASALKKRLAPYRSNSEPLSFLRALMRLNAERVAKTFVKLGMASPPGKRSALGGKIIAFVGGDGAGKSTNVSALAKVLSKQFATVSIHIGRPGRSVRGLAVSLCGKVCRLFGLHQCASALALLVTALNRRRAFARAQHARECGRIVVLDRLPLPGITRMDCPRIHTIANGKFKRLAAWERRLHEEIHGVDALIVLKLDPQIALSRRPGDDPDELLLRSGEIWNEAWHVPYARVIDTGLSDIASVQRQVLGIAWECISNPFRRVELLGLSGAGKSTLIKMLADHVPNMRTSLPYWDHVGATFCGALRGLPSAIRAYLKTKNMHVAKECLQLFAAGAMLRKFDRTRFPAGHFILDQGPAFQYALARKEKVLGSSGQRIALAACRSLEFTIRLDVPVAELQRRVIGRRNHVGRAPLLREDEFARFCNDYDMALDEAARAVGKGFRVDASQPAETVSSQVLELLRLPA